MSQCSIYDSKSLNFFRAVGGLIPLVAFFTHNIWLVLLTALLFLLGAFSMKLNIIYQLYNFFSNKVMKKQIVPIEKETGEIRFVYTFTATCFFLSFFLIYFGKFVTFAWWLDLVVAFLTLLASFANFCLAALMYTIFKKVFTKDKFVP